LEAVTFLGYNALRNCKIISSMADFVAISGIALTNSFVLRFVQDRTGGRNWLKA
jgi:hypothetical protein